MSGIPLLWAKNRVHLKTRITVIPTKDTIIFKNSEIVSWFYTSASGLVMKHLPESISFGKFVNKMTPKPLTEKIIAIYREPLTNTSKLLQFSHFELLIFQLSKKTLNQDIIIQKFESNSKPILHVCSYKHPEFSLSSRPLSGKYLVNGKYKSEETERLALDSLNHSNELSILNDSSDIEMTYFVPISIKTMSEEVLKHLNKSHGAILSCAFEFLQDDAGFYLVDVLDVTEGVTLAGKCISRCVSENIPAPKPPSRPVTARSINRSFQFTHQETSVSTSRHVTTPRKFKLSYEYPNRSTQTQPQDCCSEFVSMEILEKKISEALKRREKLKQDLEKVGKDNEEKMIELDIKWKNKAFEVNLALAERKISQSRRSVSRGKGIKRLLM